MSDNRKDSSEKSEQIPAPQCEFIAPCMKLKDKAGSGGIPSFLIDKGQSFIKNNTVDFVPYGQQYIKNIETYLIDLFDIESESEQKKYTLCIRQQIMQLKAHGGMFNYETITEVSAILLKVLEHTDIFNKDLAKIIRAHNNTITMLMQNQIQATTDIRSKAVIKELRGVIGRYHKKYK